MSTPFRPGRVLPALVLLIVAAVGADVVRRGLERPVSPAPAGDTVVALGGMSAPAPRRPSPDPAAVAAARAEVRERIRAAAASSYLPQTVDQADSMVRRWADDRFAHALRVAVLREPVEGFREAYVGNVVWAIARWNGVTPVFLQTGADSSRADIVVRWVVRLDSNRTGRTDLTWDRRGNIHHAVVLLATHTPDGRLLDARRMTALALHEIGHALGLGHSPAASDALYPVTLAQDLTERDRRTATLLYELPQGSIR